MYGSKVRGPRSSCLWPHPTRHAAAVYLGEILKRLRRWAVLPHRLSAWKLAVLLNLSRTNAEPKDETSQGVRDRHGCLRAGTDSNALAAANPSLDRHLAVQRLHSFAAVASNR